MGQRVPVFASVYSGAGGLDIGFVEAGFSPVFAIDTDMSAISTLVASLDRFQDRFPHLDSNGHEVIHGDVDDHIEVLASLQADVVIGGPPCQGFSVAGKMDPADPRSRHVWRFLDTVAAIGPSCFVMENVRSLATNRRWVHLLDSLRVKAEHLGYRTKVLVLNAAQYGVPQVRERMFLVGSGRRSSLRTPVPTTSACPISVREALSTLPPWRTAGNDMLCMARVIPAKRPVMRRSPYAGMLFNGSGRPMRLDSPAPTLPASMGGNRTPIVDQECLEGSSECWAVRYHAYLEAGGSPIAKIPERLRRITVQEAAAIQGFPIDMVWRGTRTSIYKQIGNAVPPPLGRAVALSIVDMLFGNTRPPI